MAKFDLLVAGEINPDLILSGDVVPSFGQVEKLVESASLTIGSSSVIFACGAARLGLNVRMTGVVGQDLFGNFMLTAMQDHGVDISAVIVDPQQQTGLSLILNRGSDRAILTYPGTIDALTAEHLDDDLLLSACHLHIASYFLQTRLQPGLPNVFARARSLGVSISLDTNWDPAGSWGGVKHLLPGVDVFFPNQAEALSLTGEANADQACRALDEYGPRTVVKLGVDGGLVVDGERLVRVKPPPMQVVDTVGAGDSFDAGFVYGYLQGWPLARSLLLAVSCGSLSTRSAGGVAAQPNLEEAERFMETLTMITG